MSLTANLMELKAAAERLKESGWTADGSMVFASDGDSVCHCDTDLGHLPEPVWGDSRAAFIALANPSAILALVALVEAQVWRDLTISKPAEGAHVIIALDTGNVVTGFRFSAGWHWDETDCEADADAAATHWRPLPAPPSKEADHGQG